jgi:RNA polymerase sigma factor (sigma-70 family)
MAGGQVGAVVRQIERLFTAGSVSGMSEGQLLERFVSRHDQAAFEALMSRHGPMVLGVCRRVLRDPNDVDDAFQATFLVLVRKAGSLRDRDLLANWLYGVAYRVSLRARAVSARRRAIEAAGVEELADGPEATDRGPWPWLHEEVHRLPEKYRAPIVLCYLEGLTHDEAADRLRWPVGTVKGRLSRARELLRSRLTRRGLTLEAGALTALFVGDASAAIPPVLVDSTIKAAALVAAGKAAAAGTLSAGAASLMQGTLIAMDLTKLKTIAASLALAGLLTTGAGVLAYQSQGREGKPDRTTARPAAAVPSPKASGAAMAMPVLLPSEPIQTQAIVNKDLWDKLLKQYPDPPPAQIDRLFHWSRAAMEAQQYLGQIDAGDDQRRAALEAHRDRMLQLYRITQSLTGPNQAAQADAARAIVQQIGRELPDVRPEMDRPQSNPPARPNRPEPPQEAAFSEEDDVVGSKGMDRLDFRMLARATGTPLPRPGGMGMAMKAGKPGMATDASGPGGGIASEGSGPGGGSEARGNYDPKFMIRLDIAQLAADAEAHDTSPKSRAILKKLEEPMAMRFANETPLEDILKYIMSATATNAERSETPNRPPPSEEGPGDIEKPAPKAPETPKPGKTMRPSDPLENGIPIYVDPRGLSEAEKTMTSPVTLDLEGVPLKTTLRLLLRQLGLAYCVKDGLLIISSPEGISQELIEFVATHPRRTADDGGSSGGSGGPE